MYNKTNVNSKCSMRIIEGCKGQTPLASLPPELAPASLESGPSTLPNATGWTFRGENKNALRDVIELRAWKAGEVVATCLLSLRHRGEGNTEAQPWSAHVPAAPASCSSDGHLAALKTSNGMDCLHKVRRTDNVP